MSCALWLKNLHLNPIIIERNRLLGGQLNQITRLNRWVLGSIDKTSAELAQIYAEHISRENIDVRLDCDLASLFPRTDGFDVIIDNNGVQSTIAVRALVIATGCRALGKEIFANIPGFDEADASGRISAFPLDHLDKLEHLKGKAVTVIGGGDNAFYTASDLMRAGANVTMLIRSRPKARPSLYSSVTEESNPENLVIHTHTYVNAIKDTGKGLILKTNGDDVSRFIEAERVFIRAGFAANTEFCDRLTALADIAKEKGYFITNTHKQTNIEWVYAVGDAANHAHQSVVGALADGALAAQDIGERV